MEAIADAENSPELFKEPDGLKAFALQPCHNNSAASVSAKKNPQIQKSKQPEEYCYKKQAIGKWNINARFMPKMPARV